MRNGDSCKHFTDNMSKHLIRGRHCVLSNLKEEIHEMIQKIETEVENVVYN